MSVGRFIVLLRYFALAALALALLLIWARWKYPRQSGRDPGSLEQWRDAWDTWRERRAYEREQSRNHGALRAKTVLLADPDDRAARVMTWRLESLDCTVLRARSGRAALRVDQQSAPDVVVADALLPDVSAIQFYEQLGAAHRPVVFVGVLREQWDALHSLGANVACFGKPYDPDEVAAQAGAMLRRADRSLESR